MGEYNWKYFFKQSDRFIQEWRKSPEECARNSVYLQASGGEKSFLYEDKNFMPEPFLGNPERCSAVMLNLNPAAPMDKFHVDKKYAEKIISDGYSERAQKWTIFEENDGGFIWWAKRENWLNRILGNKDTTLKPFSIDICPWHSKSWGRLDYQNKNLIDTINENVLTPAFNAVKNSRIPFAIAIGKDFYDVLTIEDENNEPYLGFTQKECVVAGCYNKQAEDLRIIKWPKNKNKIPVNKAFAIFENDRKNRILCIWCPDGGSNQPPQSGFDELVQNFVKKYENNI